MDKVHDIMKDFVERQIKSELDEKPTFTEDMAEHIRNVYADLQRQKEEWLKNKQEKNESES
jgi:hypothetical protein